MDHSRYYKNPYIEESKSGGRVRTSFLNGNQLSDELLGRVKALDSELEMKLDQVLPKLLQSKSVDHTVYTGTTGIALLHLLKYKRTRNNMYLHKAEALVEDGVRRCEGRDVSFLLGDAGPLALAASVHFQLGRHDLVKGFIQKLVELPGKVQERTRRRPPPSELLYGEAGYLYSLLYLRQELGHQWLPVDSIKQTVRRILGRGVEDAGRVRRQMGANYSVAPLYFEWYDTAYLGAAHGTAGILYICLAAAAVEEECLTGEELERLIRPTLDWLLSQCLPSGNFGAVWREETDSLVHWCHGAPGFISLYALAYQIFKERAYLECALRCGEVVWSRGLLKKGYSLCHGVAGNAYSFIQLYRLTSDLIHLERAACFADWCTHYPRAEDHRPDSPYSLFEGVAGLDYFLTDIQDLPNAAFPCFALH